MGQWFCAASAKTGRRRSVPVSYTHLDVYKRQEQLPAFSLGDRTVDLGASLVRAQDGREWTLTAKEHALLKKLYENRNRIVTSDALCQAAWGDDLYGYENTLMVHIRRMREKLEQDPSHPQYLLTARGLGYKLQLAPTKNA